MLNALVVLGAVGPHIAKKVLVMGLFGNKETKEVGAADDLIPKKSDFVEKIAKKVVDEEKIKEVVQKLERKDEMEKFYHEMTQNEKLAELKAELAKKEKEIEELKEEIRALRGKAGGIGMGGSPAQR